MAIAHVSDSRNLQNKRIGNIHLPRICMQNEYIKFVERVFTSLNCIIKPE